MAKETDPLAKAEADSTFWRENYEKLEAKYNELAATVVQRSKALAQTDAVAVGKQAQIDELRKDVSDAYATRDAALKLLRELRDHVAGRNGMLEKSTRFCAQCNNAVTCPVGKVTDMIGG